MGEHGTCRTVASVADLAAALDAARAAGAVVVGIDGRSGSGKTALTALLVGVLPRARVLHLDDVYRGWSGLAEGLDHIGTSTLAPLRRGEPGRHQRWDWAADRPEGWVVVPPLLPGEVLLVEGCGAIAAPLDAHVDVGVWCRAPAEVRHARAMARDGGGWADHWERWARQEDALVRRQDPDLCWDTA